MNQKTQLISAVFVVSLLFVDVSMAATAQDSAGKGLNQVVVNISTLFKSVQAAIPVIAFVLGAISFFGGIWAFRQAGNQQAPQKWQVGATIALVVGVFLMYWTTAQTIGGSTLLGSKAAPSVP